jgi:hypothetical protein
MSRSPMLSSVLVLALMGGVISAVALAGSAPPKSEVAAPTGDSRSSAQSGLDFLATATVDWQRDQKCYGCHVQAHALEAMSVGLSHQYRVRDDQLAVVMAGLTTIPGGTRTAGGLRYAHGDTLQAPSIGFGGAALARYDGLVDGALTDDLLQAAAQLEALQRDDGSVIDPGGWTNAPVGIAGTAQMTYQAIATWRQAYERSADDRWMVAAAQAEDHLHGLANALNASTPTQQINYALLGLVHAGATTSEDSVGAALRLLLERQGEDGGWGQQPGAASDALATGQTLYTLRKLGLTEADDAVEAATGWLVSRQLDGGSWSTQGEAKAEAMWAVLGLVSVDLMRLTLNGIEDGQHVSGTVQVSGRAVANEGAAVKTIELRVDDRVVSTSDGGQLNFAWDTASLGTGRHVIELRATNKENKTSLRRIEVYAGDVFLTRVSSRWDDGGTLVSARDLAPAGRGHTVRMTIKKDKDGVPGAELLRTEEPGRQGPVQFFWDGKDTAGAGHLGERVHAVLEVIEGGAVVQTESTILVHASPDWRQERFAGIQGKIDLGGADDAVNTLVELVDEAGRIIASEVTTDQGQYRFDDVDAGKYRVRVKKEGWKTQEAEVQASPAAAAAEADISLE